MQTNWPLCNSSNASYKLNSRNYFLNEQLEILFKVFSNKNKIPEISEFYLIYPSKLMNKWDSGPQLTPEQQDIFLLERAKSL